VSCLKSINTQWLHFSFDLWLLLWSIDWIMHQQRQTYWGKIISFWQRENVQSSLLKRFQLSCWLYHLNHKRQNITWRSIWNKLFLQSQTYHSFLRRPISHWNSTPCFSMETITTVWTQSIKSSCYSTGFSKSYWLIWKKSVQFKSFG